MKHLLVGLTNGKCTWRVNLWPRSLKLFSFVVLSFCFSALSSPVLGLDQETIRQIGVLKKMGLSDEAIVEILRLDKGDQGPQYAVGVKEIPRSDGRKDFLYYSVTTPEERRGRVREREFEYQNSWRVPEHIILDQRRKR